MSNRYRYCRVLPRALPHFRLVQQVKSLLERPKARPAALVQAHHLAVENRRILDACLHSFDHVRELDILRPVVPADDRGLFAVKAAQYPQAVKLGLERQSGSSNGSATSVQSMSATSSGIFA